MTTFRIVAFVTGLLFVSLGIMVQFDAQDILVTDNNTTMFTIAFIVSLLSMVLGGAISFVALTNPKMIRD
jgi:hypothetical protein